MFGFNSWSDFTTKAAESLQTATDQAKSGLQNVSNKTKELANTFPDNAKTKLSQFQENVTTFVADQRSQYKQVEHETELKKRRKERKAKLLKYGIPPWHVFEEANATPTNENTDNNEDNESKNENDENNNDKKNCTYEELRLLILKLCEDENTFLVEAPTSITVFPFDMETALPYANAALNYDPILPRIRYKLVPKRVSETQFWKNYFYRVQLIRESMGYPKIDLSSNAKTSTEQLKQQSKLNEQNEKNKEKLDTPNKEVKQSIFEQNSELNNNNSNNNKNDNNNLSTNDNSTNNQNTVDNDTINKNNNDSNNLINNESGNNDNNDDTESNNLINSVVSLDSSENSIGASETVIVTPTPATNVNGNNTDSNNNNNTQKTDSNAMEDNDDDDMDDQDDEDDDFMASSDLHIDALSPAARARMQQELGLNNNNKNNNNKSNDNNDNNNDDNNEKTTDDTDDVDALLANVDVDGGSDISDDELAKVMSEVENA